MKSTINARVALVVVMTATAAFAQLCSIPADQVDSKKVFWGSTAGFEKPAEVDYDAVLKVTPEYRQMKKDRVERGTGKYWILLNQATDRSTRAITEVGQDTEYDLIAQRGYLASLTPAIPADDVTPLVVSKIEGGSKIAKAKKSGKNEKSDEGDSRTAKAEPKAEKKAEKQPKSDSAGN
ncbi:MAG: hypothetical protein HUU46_10610 [Candidatus Hydrogenedentes bacterium]|nr:hypothetical protein [Candidatus Hydrogenedentota bacterium]